VVVRPHLEFASRDVTTKTPRGREKRELGTAPSAYKAGVARKNWPKKGERKRTRHMTRGEMAPLVR